MCINQEKEISSLKIRYILSTNIVQIVGSEKCSIDVVEGTKGYRISSSSLTELRGYRIAISGEDKETYVSVIV